MVDLLKKPTGFRRDMFHDFELEKAERAKSLGVVPEVSEAVWKADDPRWNVKPPYGWVSYTLRWGGPCVYCGDRIEAGTYALYSKKINSVAHRECHAGVDT